MIVPCIPVARDLRESEDVKTVRSWAADGPRDLTVRGEVEVYVAFCGSVVWDVKEDFGLNLARMLVRRDDGWMRS